MGRKTDTTTNQAQQQSAADERKAGMGGSYTLNPATGDVTLNERTQAGTVSRKKPTTDEQGNEVPGVDATDA